MNQFLLIIMLNSQTEEWERGRQYSFHRTLCLRGPIWKKSWPYLICWIYCWRSWSTCIIFSHGRPSSTNLPNATLITHLWDSFIVSDQLRASWVIIQEHEIWDETSSPTIILLLESSQGKQEENLKKLQNSLFSDPFCPNQFWVKLCYFNF